jgi:hypothetical protein
VIAPLCVFQSLEILCWPAQGLASLPAASVLVLRAYSSYLAVCEGVSVRNMLRTVFELCGRRLNIAQKETTEDTGAGSAQVSTLIVCQPLLKARITCWVKSSLFSLLLLGQASKKIQCAKTSYYNLMGARSDKSGRLARLFENASELISGRLARLLETSSGLGVVLLFF